MAVPRCAAPFRCLILACALQAGQASAQDLGKRGGVSPIHGEGRFSIVVENDLFTFGTGEKTDRFYTNGVFLHSEWSSPALDQATNGHSIAGLVPAKDRAFLGLGLTHELHTPETINPCGARYDAPLATSEEPGQVGLPACQEAESDWRNNYASSDHPFVALWSVFVTAQRYFHAQRDTGPLSQLRLWARFDVGAFGEDAARGYEVQKNWHGFFNDAVLGAGDEPAATPIGWRLGDPGLDSTPLIQISGGGDLSLYRQGFRTRPGLVGVDLNGRGHLRAIVPRNDLGVGAALRLGLLPEHSSYEVKDPGELQASHFYAEVSADGSVVVTDGTHGAFDRYRHLVDEYSIGLYGKLFGLGAVVSVTWERILFRDPLELYPSREAITAAFHRYGRVALEFTY